MSEPIEGRVREIIINELGLEPEKVTDDASFVEDLGADSLDTVELVMAFEEEFGLDIPDEDAEQTLAGTLVLSILESVPVGVIKINQPG